MAFNVYGNVYGDSGVGGSCSGYPLETEVLVGTVFGQNDELIGNRTDAQEADVRLGVFYAANGVSKQGQWDGGTGDPSAPGWIG